MLSTDCVKLSAPLFSYAQLGEWAQKQRADRLTLGFTCGSFDILHAGHVDYLQRARLECDRLIVAVNSDESVRTYKNPLRPIVPEGQRAVLIAALSCVDAVTVMAETRPRELLETIKPDFYIKGGDYSASSLRSASIVEAHGGRVVLIPVEHQVSTTAIISRILEVAQYSEVAEAPAKRSPAKIALVDRDGTLIESVPFLKHREDVRLLPGVGEGLKALQDAGYLLVVITNQQGIGLGYFDYQEFVGVNSEMLRLLSPYGVRVSRIYYCPHTYADQCECRKPGKEMIERALRHFKAEASDCVLIGDSKIDVQAAKAAGCLGILLEGESSNESPWACAKNFTDAVQMIVNSDERLT